MQKWVVDGFIVGLVTVAVGGLTALIAPPQTGLPLIGSGLGAISSSATLSRRRYLHFRELEKKLSQVRSSPRIIQPSPPQPISAKQPLLTSTTSQDRGKEAVTQWLFSQNVILDKYHIPDQADEIFNKHAQTLGNNLKDKNQPLLAPLLKQIKWAISNKRGLQYHLKNASQLQVRISTQFCQDIYSDSLLSSYRYSKDDRVIHGAIQDRVDVRSFFNGNWFERFIFSRISGVLQEHKLPYSYLINPVIQFPNEDRYELDLLFFAKGSPILVECKTGGDFNAHLKKFSDHCKRLSVPCNRAFLVVLDLDEAQTVRLSKFWQFQVVNQDNIIPLLQAAISSEVS